MTPSAGKQHAEPSLVPPQLSDLHCFTETDGVITTTMFDVPGYKVVAGAGDRVRVDGAAAELGGEHGHGAQEPRGRRAAVVHPYGM